MQVDGRDVLILKGKVIHVTPRAISNFVIRPACLATHRMLCLADSSASRRSCESELLRFLPDNCCIALFQRPCPIIRSTTKRFGVLKNNGLSGATSITDISKKTLRYDYCFAFRLTTGRTSSDLSGNLLTNVEQGIEKRNRMGE